VRRVQTLTFHHLRSLIISTTQHERDITELSGAEGSLEGLVQQVTIDRDPESEVETAIGEQAGELVNRIHVLVKWHLAKTIEGRILSRTTGLFDDGVIEPLMFGVVRGNGGRGEDRVLQSVTMRILRF